MKKLKFTEEKIAIALRQARPLRHVTAMSQKMRKRA
jgi:hypothetical protein